jgi:hypothetical protein
MKVSSISLKSLSSAWLLLLSPALATTDIASLQAEVESLQSVLNNAEAKLRTLKLTLTQERAAVDKAMLPSRSAVEPVSEQEVAKIKEEFSVYKQAYRTYIRAKAPGMILTSLRLKEHDYPSLKVRSVDDTWFSFQHEGGMARLLMSEVTQEIRDLFACEHALTPQATTASLTTNAVSLPSAPAAPEATEPEQVEATTGTSYHAATTDSAGQLLPTNERGEPTLSLAEGMVLPPPGKTPDGNDIITINGKTAILLNKNYPGQSGSTTKGGVSKLPPGYKPIGSSFSTEQKKKK